MFAKPGKAPHNCAGEGEPPPAKPPLTETAAAGIIQPLNIGTFMSSTTSPDSHRDLIILEEIEQQPDSTQATLAAKLGVAIGTINWHLKRLVDKGYVKVRRIERRKFRYLITPEGVALRARLTVDYIQTSFGLYRLIRQRTQEALAQAHAGGAEAVRVIGEGEVAEVCRLTCLEQGLPLLDAEAPANGRTALLRIKELKIFLEWEEKRS